MKRRLSELATLALALTGCLLAQFAPADGLPNAWQVNSIGSYTYDLTNELQIAATNTTGGFDYTINARFLSGSTSTETIAMAYGLGTNRFLIWFSLNTNGDLTADLDSTATFTLTTNGTGATLYHYHEILYNPATAQASYLFDGRVMTTNWAPTGNSLTNGQILWGAGNSSGAGTMNFHTVVFKITNTVVAAYDAGSAPDTAQDPTNAIFGWALSPDDSASVTNISADAVPLATTPLPTTLDATNVATHQATLLGTGDQGNLAATVWFEWGADTNYGNTTPSQLLLSDTNNFNVSQTINGLVKGTAYHYRCAATNLQGIAYGQDVTFITPATMTVTNSDDTGPGTLRQAIADSVSGDIIVIAIDVGNTITLTNGQLFITNDLTIISTNATITIDAGGNSRVLEIGSSNTVILDSLTITNGNAFDVGGGILVDSGATLTLTNCTVAGNVAGAGGGIFISTNSIVTINNCLFSVNSATNNGGAIDNEPNSTLAINDSFLTGNSAQRGGAIFSNFGTNLLNHCTFSTNSAQDGGAIANSDSVLIATNLNVSANLAASGGGIFNVNNSILALNDSTLSGNTGTNFGGGIINTNGGTVTLNNSTLSDNSCPADQGGGIDNWSVITVNNCTIAGSTSGGGFVNNGGVAVCNNSTFSGNVALFDGGGFYAIFGTNILNNCTISGNSANRRAGGIYENNSLSLLTNTIVAGNMAVRSNANILGIISGANNLTNGNPLLAPLGNYGGLTQTMPPLTGSPAINAGVDSVTNLFTTDQRGYPRLASTHVDIGAVEIQPSIVINTNDDGPGSLRAVAATAPPLIAFTNTLSGQTIHLTSGQITLSNSVGIDASGLASAVLIDAGGVSRVLEITASNVVTLDSLTITNGNVSDNGGGILVDDDATLTLANSTVTGNVAGAGGGIFISTNSIVAINNCNLSGNFATNNGGAINNDTNSTLTVNNSAFSANSANSGGAVFNYFGADTFNNCVFSNNASTSDTGGGVCNTGSLMINNCTLDGNIPGGGIAQSSGILTANNSTVSHNTSIQSGGGFDIAGGQATLNNCTLFGNSTGGSGGGIAIDAGVTNMLNNCTINGNSAGSGGGISQDPSGTSILTNTIVAGNTATNAPDILGPFSGANNLTGGNPLLAPFGNYGGPTLTMPPLAGSAAIDAGLDSVTTLFTTDQRGYPRQSGPQVDIGAVEAQLAPANKRPVLQLSRTQPGGTLSITFTNIPNIDFTVLSSTNVALPWTQWTILGPAIQNPPGRYQLTDPTPTTNRARFYLVVSP